MTNEAVVHPSSTPTADAFATLDEAYAFFNERLFGGELPTCLIALHRHRGAYGYFAPKRFEHASGERVVDEIALNPDHFKDRADEKTLSTLVHEMCHLWQEHFGKAKPKRGYHNKEWAAKMDAVGLYPSSTGAPGGRRTGPRVSHFIVERGAFQRACAELMARGIGIQWRSIPNSDLVKKSKKPTKYECPECGAAVRGKSGYLISCRECERSMDPVDPDHTDEPELPYAPR